MKKSNVKLLPFSYEDLMRRHQARTELIKQQPGYGLVKTTPSKSRIAVWVSSRLNTSPSR